MTASVGMPVGAIIRLPLSSKQNTFTQCLTGSEYPASRGIHFLIRAAIHLFRYILADIFLSRLDLSIFSPRLVVGISWTPQDYFLPLSADPADARPAAGEPVSPGPGKGGEGTAQTVGFISSHTKQSCQPSYYYMGKII